MSLRGKGQPRLPPSLPPSRATLSPAPWGSVVLSLTRTCKNFMAPGTLNSEPRDRISEVMPERSDSPPAAPYKSGELGGSVGGAGGQGGLDAPSMQGQKERPGLLSQEGCSPPPPAPRKRLGAEGQLQERVFMPAFRQAHPQNS